MNIEAPASKARFGGEAGLTIIDCDVHPVVAGGFTPLYPLMPKAWGERFRLKLARVPNILPLTFRFEHPTGSAARHDAVTPSGGPAGSDPEYMRRDLLDANGISLAVLTSLQAGQMGTVISGPVRVSNCALSTSASTGVMY